MLYWLSTIYIIHFILFRKKRCSVKAVNEGPNLGSYDIIVDWKETIEETSAASETEKREGFYIHGWTNLMIHAVEEDSGMLCDPYWFN